MIYIYIRLYHAVSLIRSSLIISGIVQPLYDENGIILRIPGKSVTQLEHG